MFDATKAALLMVDIDPPGTHKGLMVLFGRHLVQTWIVSRDLGRALNEVASIRLLADYVEGELPEDQASWAIEQAAVFLAEIERTGSARRGAAP